MLTNDNDRHDMLRILGQINKHDAELWIHSNNNPGDLYFIICVECNGHERDFRNIADAWLWYWNELARQKQYERNKKNEYARNHYWKKHKTGTEGG